MRKPSLDRLLDFQRLLLQFSQIERVVHRKHTNGYVRENDTEHSYNLAMTAWFLAPHFPELDPNLLIRYALVHDVVEVHAGDTYVFADALQLSSKPERERAALRRLEAEWPDFLDLTDTIHIYEARGDNESKFIYALDKIMPIMQIYISDGHTWKKENLTLKVLHHNKQSKISVSKDIEPYYKDLMALLEASPELIRKS